MKKFFLSSILMLVLGACPAFAQNQTPNKLPNSNHANIENQYPQQQKPSYNKVQSNTNSTENLKNVFKSLSTNSTDKRKK